MNIKDLKAFYIGQLPGTAIYVGSTKVWPICNPQMVTVANPVPYGTTIVDECTFDFSNYDGTINQAVYDFLGRDSSTLVSTVKEWTGDISNLSWDLRTGVLSFATRDTMENVTIKVKNGILNGIAKESTEFIKSITIDLNNAEITSLRWAFGAFAEDNQATLGVLENVTILNAQNISGRTIDIEGLACNNNITDLSFMRLLHSCTLSNCKNAFRCDDDRKRDFIWPANTSLFLIGDCTNLFRGSLITSIPSTWKIDEVTSLEGAFENCVNLITLEEIDCSQVDSNITLSGCRSLTTVGGFKGFGNGFVNNHSLFIYDSNNLSQKSIDNIVNSIGIPPVEYCGIYFGNELQAYVDESTLTAKGWTVYYL